MGGMLLESVKVPTRKRGRHEPDHRLHVGGLHWATSERAVEAALLRRPGVEAVEANAVNQTASVTFDPSATSLGELAAWVRDCGYHCAGRSVPTTSAHPRRSPPA